MSPVTRPSWARVRREAAAIRNAVRAAPRRTVVIESVLAGLVLVCSLVPVPLIPPAHPVPVALVGVWAALLVPARRRYPTLAVLGCMPVLAGENVWATVVVPCVVWSAVRRIPSARRAWAAVGATAAGSVLLAVVGQAQSELPALPYLVTGAGLAALFVLLPALSGRVMGHRRPLLGLLRERNAYLEQARLLTDEAARMEERTRIAAEMHDLLGHRIGLISVHAGALQLAAEKQAPPLAPQAELLHTTAGTAMDELRGILGVLRHRSGEDIGERGTREDLSALVVESRNAGVDVELHWNGHELPDADARTRQAVHRVTREGLTNALKHAPGARVRVTFQSEDGSEGESQGRGRGGGVGETVVITVVNGAPPTPRSPGAGNRSGLVGLHERISLLGGTMHAGPRPDGGFALSARIPVRPDAQSAYALSSKPLSDGAGSRPPLSTEVLTWPRILGGGCAALLVLLPTIGGTIALLIMAVLD
ncbi:sensor histidine kinase [Streptomyces sp. NPDC059897]|uniref:sensor histidine kinase n=1 Tax=Streptomyces sp. NPDC059897 TaxID=3346994 RepID=UPI003665E16D